MKNLSELFDENSDTVDNYGENTMSKETFIKVVEERIREELITYDELVIPYNVENSELRVDQYLQERKEAENG